MAPAGAFLFSNSIGSLKVKASSRLTRARAGGECFFVAKARVPSSRDGKSLANRIPFFLEDLATKERTSLGTRRGGFCSELHATELLWVNYHHHQRTQE